MSEKQVYTPIALRGTIEFAHLDAEDPVYGGYKLTLTNLSEEAVAGLKALGVVAKRTPEGAFFIKAKSKNPVPVIGPDNVTLKAKVGNGSTGVVKLVVTELAKARKIVDEKTDAVITVTHGVYLDKVKVEDLVEYEDGDDFDSAL